LQFAAGEAFCKLQPMFDNLKSFCSQFLPFSAAELAMIDVYFELLEVPRKGMIQEAGRVCDFLAFIDQGAVRHFHVKEGEERCCDLSFENSWVTDFASFNSGKTGVMHLQALENCRLFVIKKPQLMQLYAANQHFERFGRRMAEQVAERASDIAMSLSSEKPAERFEKLLAAQPDLFQRVPQKYIANFLGVSPESLSRIRKRLFAQAKS